MTVTETAEMLGISRNNAYQLVRAGRIPSVRLGRRLLIPRQALEAWLVKEATRTGAAWRN